MRNTANVYHINLQFTMNNFQKDDAKKALLAENSSKKLKWYNQPINHFLILFAVTVMIIHILILISELSLTTSKITMRKRCRNEMYPSLKRIYSDRDLVSFQVLNSSSIFKVPYENALKCDSHNETCEEGYVWSSPVNSNKLVVKIDYRMNYTKCDRIIPWLQLYFIKCWLHF